MALPPVTRLARHLLIAAFLLFAQHAAQLHGLSHAFHDVAVAEHGTDGAPLDHDAHKCVSFLAVGSAAPNAASHVVSSEVSLQLPPAAHRAYLPVSRIVFDSRAPPFSA
jgi:hypothetical protein